MLLLLPGMGGSPAQADPFAPFSFAPQVVASQDDITSLRMAETRITVDSTGHVNCTKDKTYDFVFYSETDAAHRYPIRVTGQGSVRMTGEYDPLSPVRSPSP